MPVESLLPVWFPCSGLSGRGRTCSKGRGGMTRPPRRVPRLLSGIVLAWFGVVALDAEDHEGVDLDRVKQAKEALATGDMLKTQLLLEQALGACPGQPVTSPTGVRTKLPQTPCPTPAHELALGRVPLHGTTKPVLLTIGAVLALGGLALSWRIR